MFRKTWRLKSKVINWIYTAIVRPTVTTASVWWTRTKLKTSRVELSKLQRMACLGIIGPIRTASTTAMEVLLGLPPLCLQLEMKAKVGIYRLYCSDQWKHKSEGFGHAYITRDMKNVQ
jgi:hypothetical protein